MRFRTEGFVVGLEGSPAGLVVSTGQRVTGSRREPAWKKAWPSAETASLLAFVHAEFERYLRCGRLEESFIRLVCTGRRHEHLVAFSC